MPTVWDCSACNGRYTAVGEPENATKRRKALLSEEQLVVRHKVRKASKRELLKHMSRLCKGKNKTKHIDKHKHISLR